jgi:hypothetical protein
MDFVLSSRFITKQLELTATEVIHMYKITSHRFMPVVGESISAVFRMVDLETRSVLHSNLLI